MSANDPGGAAGVTIRRARTADVRSIRAFVDAYAPERKLLNKPTVTLFEDVQEFWVAEPAADEPANIGTADNQGAARVVGCGALHVMWEDLAEVRTLAVDPRYRGGGVGHLVLERLLLTARELGIKRVFCLTFEVSFFARHGFVTIDGSPVAPDVFDELLRSYDEGVAEFLDLERVKPNTLGNTRMLLHL